MASSSPNSASEGDAYDEAAGTTGRYLVVFSDEVRNEPSEIASALTSIAGVTSITSSLDFDTSGLDVDQAATSDATIFARLGVAVVQANEQSQVAALTAAASEDQRILAVEPERILYAINDTGAIPLEYVRGYRDGIDHLYEQLAKYDTVDTAADLAETYVDNDAFTWGLQATKASTSSLGGRGIRVAVLDTGFDLAHPDFSGRVVTHQSFVPGEAVQDRHGHGTHCVGTSCGPVSPATTRRYGVAHEADIYVGKVLNNRGSGSDTNIIAGIEWALANGCHVVSMSLGASIRQVSVAYEQVGLRALKAGTLIVAAAGNEADRKTGKFAFVGIPANSPSIMAVGALDSQLRIADFSCRSNPVQGGQVDIAAPGVAVHSSWPMATRYRTISGTSMATPHVAGIAALWCKATGATGSELWATVIQAARRLDLPSVDVGAGLAQAPQ